MLERHGSLNKHTVAGSRRILWRSRLCRIGVPVGRRADGDYANLLGVSTTPSNFTAG